MNSFSLFALMRQMLGSLCQILLQPVRLWAKPDNHAPIPDGALDLTRSKPELMLENALLRQQLIALQRDTKNAPNSPGATVPFSFCWPADFLLGNRHWSSSCAGYLSHPFVCRQANCQHHPNGLSCW